MLLPIGSSRGGLLLGASLALACGSGDDLAPSGAVVDEVPATVEVVGLPAPVEEGELGMSPESEPGATDGVEPEGEELDPEGEGTGCVVPPRVSRSPQNIPAALELMNSLPKPTTLECFLQSLQRPLALHLTSSGGSLQPSPGARSPRTFIVNGDLVMSVVLDGEARETLELGYQTAPDRSIKTEILFPLEQDVTMGGVFDRVQVGQVTMCGACHTGEILESHEGFPGGAFESTVIVPSSVFQVDLESLRAEEASCDPAAESYRCGMLDALFDYGEVQQSPLWLDAL